MEIKIWKDDQGYAFDFEDNKFELTRAGYDELLAELAELHDESLIDAECVMRHLFIDLEERN